MLRECVSAFLLLILSLFSDAAADTALLEVNESVRTIPVAYEVDVVVIGGSTGAVSAAVAAAREGAQVFLAAPRPYLGEDVCGTLRLWPAQHEKPSAPLAKQLFGDGGPVRPMHVKRTLDRAMLSAGVRFLYGCYATDALLDGTGRLAGIVMANRAGRQAVRAKVVIDATDRAWLARKAGGAFDPYPAGPQKFRRVVVGGEPRQGEGIRARLAAKITSGGNTYDAIEYTLTIPMKDASFASFASAEQKARDMTFHPRQVDSSEVLFQVPPDPMRGMRKQTGDWPGAANVDLRCFRPAGKERLYVLGGCADISRSSARKLLEPCELIAVGGRIGKAAAEEAGKLPRPVGMRPAKANKARPQRSGDVFEFLSGVRPGQGGLSGWKADARSLPVLGSYDVVVVGGGTSGAPAAIAAARRGAKVLVIEYLHELGGVGTLGMVGKYYYGHRRGFTAEVTKGIKSMKAAVGIIGKAEWWRREIRKAGGEIWLCTMGCGAFAQDKRVKGVVVATPEGRGVVLANVVIDSTGNADIAAAAGAECDYTGAEHIAVQGAGLPKRELGVNKNSTDFDFVDDTDMVDVWRMLVYSRDKYKDAYDMGQMLDTRERRRIVGDFVITPIDIVNQRTYPDSIGLSYAYFDSHGYVIAPLFLLDDSARRTLHRPYTPFRCLLPRGMKGILVTGLGMSAHRDAMALLRMQADLQNQGYAAGVAAAMASTEGKNLREIDIRKLQKHLVQVGNLPDSVLADTDSYPIAEDRIRAAVQRFASAEKKEAYKSLAVILARPDVGITFLKDAYRKAKSQNEKLRYAQVLGMLHDATGVPTLVQAVDSFQGFDRGMSFRGWGGMSISYLDSLIIALGRTRDPRAVKPLLAKVALLNKRNECSHIRALAIAAEEVGSPAFAEPLGRLLQLDILSGRPMTGHAILDIESAKRWASEASKISPISRRVSLRELVLARAVYRCGDYKGIGEKILKQYARDLRGHYARHAQAVLKEKRKEE